MQDAAPSERWDASETVKSFAGLFAIGNPASDPPPRPGAPPAPYTARGLVPPPTPLTAPPPPPPSAHHRPNTSHLRLGGRGSLATPMQASRMTTPAGTVPRPQVNWLSRRRAA